MYPRIDQSKCIACGICAELCGLDVLKSDWEGRPSVNNTSFCNACGHCVALCPRDAISLEGIPREAFVSIGTSDCTPTGMKNLLLAKRSCREFQSRSLSRKILEDLIEVANTAPTAINCQERSFIILADRVRIRELRAVLVKHIRSMLGMIRLATSKLAKLFLDPDTVEHMMHLRSDFEVALRHTVDGDDYIFHDAPCLVFFTGITMDPAGKDHALAAVHYFMLYAETMGLGTCINGYAQSFPKVLAKQVKVPKFHTIYGAIMLGYRKHAYRRTVYRKPALVTYY